MFLRSFVVKEQGRSEDEVFVPLQPGTGIQEALRLAGAVEDHLGITATRKGLCLRVPLSRLGDARAALHGERRQAAYLVESALYRVRSIPDDLDKNEVQDRLVLVKWQTRVRYRFKEHGVMTWIVGATDDPPT